jgi:glycerol-3-phosphate O-acyltransferase/dihydroxyacetone phosphate acyltransferase
MLFTLVRSAGRFALNCFFKQIQLRGAPLVEQGPLLIVANHPNFALDSLLIGAAFKRQLHFVAKGSLFRGTLLTWLLRELHVLPIYRRQDNPDELVKNVGAMSAVVDRLLAGGAVLIFPEGVSLGERRLLELKTGSARMAFQAEEARDFKLGLKIQPIGITYANLCDFKSSVTLQVGEPIVVTRYEAEYRSDAVRAVELLTQALEQELRKVSVDVADPSDHLLAEHLAALYRSQGKGESDFQRFSEIARHIQLLGPRYPERRKSLLSKLESYQAVRELFALEGDEPLQPKREMFFTYYRLPLVLVGLGLFFIPYRLVDWIVQKRATMPVQQASYKFAFGALLFLLWTFALSVIVTLLLGCLSCFVIAVLFLIFLALHTNRYYHQAQAYLLCALWPGSRTPLQVLSTLSNELIRECEELRQEVVAESR